MFSKIIFNSPWYYLPACLAFGFGLAYWLYYRNKKNQDVPPFANLMMFTLRSLAISLAALLLLNILFRKVTNETENPIVLLAIDNSSSLIAGSDSNFIRSEFIPKLQALKEQIGEKFSVKTILFGSTAQTSETEPDFKDKETDIENLILEAENNYSNQNIGALVIASDGIYNKGANPAYAAEKLGYPVYAIALGDTNEIKDVSIQKINHNQVAYLGNNFPVEVVLGAKKFMGREAKVTLMLNGAAKASQNIKIGSDNFSGAVQFTLSAETSGIVKYTVRVSIDDAEKNTTNNSQQFVIEVIDSKDKILLLANAPHPDVSAIKEALSGSTSYQVDYSLAQDFSKPLKQYNLVIFHGYPPNFLKLIDECKTSTVPFWIVNPPSTENIPGLRIAGAINRYNDSEPYIKKTFGLFTLSNELKNFINDLPAVKTFFGNYNLSNGSEVLLGQKLGTIETESPLLYFQETNGLKSAVFIGDGLWRWKLRDYAEHQNHNVFNELIGKTVQYLSVKADKSFFRVTGPRIIDENTPFEIGAEVYNKTYEPVTDPDVTLTLTNQENKTFNYTFSKTGSAYKLNTGNLPPGEYRYEAKVQYNNELFVKQGLLAVKEVISEKINTVANHQLLNRIANRTGGKVYYPANIQKISEEILNSERIKPVTYSQTLTSSLIDLKWLFWTLLILFTMEWFFRKRFLTI